MLVSAFKGDEVMIAGAMIEIKTRFMVCRGEETQRGFWWVGMLNGLILGLNTQECTQVPSKGHIEIVCCGKYLFRK